MAHNAQAVFFKQVRKTFPKLFEWKHVLEVGSLNINGTVRDLFTNCNYVGCDLDEGPGVDLAVQGQNLRFPDDSFDVTISAECFEHNPYWKETFLNMKRMTRPGGLITFTCAGKDRPEHGTHASDVGSSPLTVAAGWDYYKNLERHDFDSQTLAGLDPGAQDLYFVAIKDPKFPLDAQEVKWFEELAWNDINAENF
jgi:SAM-dependent methyltransferase